MNRPVGGSVLLLGDAQLRVQLDRARFADRVWAVGNLIPLVMRDRLDQRGELLEPLARLDVQRIELELHGATPRTLGGFAHA